MPKVKIVQPTFDKDAITLEDFEQAKAYFKNRSATDDSVKFSRKKWFNAPKHSFIQVDGEVYALKKRMKLGQGSFGTVRYAENAAGELFAVKISHEISIEDAAKEAEINSKLGKGIKAVAYRDSKSKKIPPNSRKIYIVMKNVGQTVRKVIDEGKVTPPMRLDLAIKAAIAVDQLHKKGYDHRDIKSDNLTVDKAGQVHLIDFGFSDKKAEPSMSNKGTLSHFPGYLFRRERYFIPHLTVVVPYLDSIALLRTLWISTHNHGEDPGILQSLTLPPCILSILTVAKQFDIEAIDFFKQKKAEAVEAMVKDLTPFLKADCDVEKLKDVLLALLSWNKVNALDIIKTYCKEDADQDQLMIALLAFRDSLAQIMTDSSIQHIQQEMQGITPLFIAALLIQYQNNPHITEEEVQALKGQPDRQQAIVNDYSLKQNPGVTHSYKERLQQEVEKETDDKEWVFMIDPKSPPKPSGPE